MSNVVTHGLRYTLKRPITVGCFLARKHHGENAAGKIVVIYFSSLLLPQGDIPMINTFVVSGEVKRLDITNKQSKKGPAAIIILQYGPSRQRTNQPVQFLNVALIRVPPYVFSKCEETLRVGSLVDITGHTQGVLKHVMTEGFVTNELVADRLQVVDDAELLDEGEGDEPFAAHEVGLDPS